MADVPLLRQYTQLVRWIEALPRAQYAIVIGGIWFTTWTLTQFLLGQSLWMAVTMGGITALIFGGLHYYQWEYR